MLKSTMFASFLIFVIGAKLSKEKYRETFVKYCKQRIDRYYLECDGTNFQKWQWKMDRFVFRMISKFTQKEMSKYYSKEECMRIECKNKRGLKNINQFLKCRKCRIASYCSRRCAKLDWNKGYHKIYCKLYYDFSTHNHKPFLL